MPYGKTRSNRRTYTKRRSGAPKKASRYTKKPRVYRRRTYSKVKSLRPKWADPMADKQLVRFVYQDTAFVRTLELANSFTSEYVFRGNSPYDPDLTGVGVQPYGFDQYMGTDLAGTFRVTASSIKIYFRMDPEYSNTRRLHCSVIPWRGTSITTLDPSDVRAINLQKETTYDGVTESTKGAQIKHYATNRMVFRDYPSNEYLLNGSYAGNPSLGWFWVIRFYADDVFDESSLYILFDVKIKYYTVISNRGEPDES